MYFTNPTERDFSSFLATYVNKEMAEEGESAEIRNFSGGIVGLFAEKKVERTDLIFGSYYHLDMSRLRDFGADIKDINMIGIFGIFLPISN
tara:strand:+ start:190 stop:462 length:273 start_codon:yes stop_codon:yes gene_type:complete